MTEDGPFTSKKIAASIMSMKEGNEIGLKAQEPDLIICVDFGTTATGIGSSRLTHSVTNCHCCSCGISAQ